MTNSVDVFVDFFYWFGFDALFYCFCALFALLPLSCVRNFLGMMLTLVSVFFPVSFLLFFRKLHAKLMCCRVHVCRSVFGVILCSFRCVPSLPPLFASFVCFYWVFKALNYAPCVRSSIPRPSVSPALLCCFVVYFAHTVPPMPSQQGYLCPPTPHFRVPSCP